MAEETNRTNSTQLLPQQIEARSFAIIEQELQALGCLPLPEETAAIIKRVIHTTADFDYVRNLYVSPDAVQAATEALCAGAVIVTDTSMAQAGINKRTAAELGCSVECLIADPEVAERARQQSSTRSVAAVDIAAARWPDGIYVVGNAPTALMRLHERYTMGDFFPRLVIGAPVGFVNVLESKAMTLEQHVPHIVTRGRKGGSNVAAAIMNALLYQVRPRADFQL